MGGGFPGQQQQQQQFNQVSVTIGSASLLIITLGSIDRSKYAYGNGRRWRNGR